MQAHVAALGSRLVSHARSLWIDHAGATRRRRQHADDADHRRRCRPRRRRVCGARVRRLLRRPNDVRRRLHGPGVQRGELWRVRPRVRRGPCLQRGRLRHVVRRRAHELRPRVRRHAQRPRTLRRLRNDLSGRHGLRGRGLRLRGRPRALRRSLRRPRERSGELRSLRQGVRGPFGVRRRDLCHDVPDGPDGMRSGVRRLEQGQPQLWRLRRRLPRGLDVRRRRLRVRRRWSIVRGRLRQCPERPGELRRLRSVVRRGPHLPGRRVCRSRLQGQRDAVWDPLHRDQHRRDELRRVRPRLPPRRTMHERQVRGSLRIRCTSRPTRRSPVSSRR